MQIDASNPPRLLGSLRKQILVVTLAAVALLIGAGALFLRSALDPGEPVPGVSTVAVRDDEFGPAAVEIPAGTTVTWTWEGSDQHNVVGDGFESDTQATGTFDRTFAEPDTYDYRCSLHFFMRGRVVVTD